jgi:uncharacterized protein (TIGR02001 family)
MRVRIGAGVVTLGIFMAAGAATAASWELVTDVGMVSDYRFRGISLSERGPALQGGVDARHESGLFVGGWASNIADNGGLDLELDWYGGYAGHGAGLDYVLRLTEYVYPGVGALDYFEFTGTLGGTLGPVEFELQLAQAPRQRNLAADNLYLGATLLVPLAATPLSLRLGGGYERGDEIHKRDWELGFSYDWRPLRVSLSYIGSNYAADYEAGRNGAGGLVAALRLAF